MRAHGVIDDLVWELLEKCWSRVPQERPPIVGLHRILKIRPAVTHIPWRRTTSGELPGALKLHVQSIKFSEYWQNPQQFYVKFKYGNRDHETSPTNLTNDLNEQTWFVLHPFQPSPLPLSPTQERPGKLGDKNR